MPLAKPKWMERQSFMGESPWSDSDISNFGVAMKVPSAEKQAAALEAEPVAAAQPAEEKKKKDEKAGEANG